MERAARTVWRFVARRIGAALGLDEVCQGCGALSVIPGADLCPLCRLIVCTYTTESAPTPADVAPWTHWGAVGT